MQPIPPGNQRCVKCQRALADSEDMAALEEEIAEQQTTMPECHLNYIDPKGKKVHQVRRVDARKNPRNYF